MKSHGNPEQVLRESLQADVGEWASRSRTEKSRAPVAPRLYSRRYAVYAVGLLSVVNAVNYMDRMALSILIPVIKPDLQLSDAQVGLLVGFAFFLFYATCGIPLARWADRGNRSSIVAMSIAVWSVMTALSGAAQNFLQLFTARVGLGASEAGCVPASQSIIADYLPAKRRSGGYAVYGLGAVLGTMLGLAVAGNLAEIVGWRWTFALLGLPGIALALLVRLTLREPTRGQSDAIVAPVGAVSFYETVTALWRVQTYRRLTLYYVVNAFIQAGLTHWYPSFYTREFGITPGAVGIYLGVSMAIGSAAGLLIGGFLANKAAQRDVRLTFGVSAATTLLSIPIALGVIFAPSLPASLLLVSVSMLLWYLPGPAVGGVLYSIANPSMRATAGALIVFCISVLGFGLGPFCVGVLSDVLLPHYGVHSLRYALTLPLCVLPVLSLVLYAVTKEVRQDLRAAGAQV